jgi:hypothetical protein
MIESKAPNIFSFDYEGNRIQLSLGEALQMKELSLSFLAQFITFVLNFHPTCQTLKLPLYLRAERYTSLGWTSNIHILIPYIYSSHMPWSTNSMFISFADHQYTIAA